MFIFKKRVEYDPSLVDNIGFLEPILYKTGMCFSGCVAQASLRGSLIDHSWFPLEPLGSEPFLLGIILFYSFVMLKALIRKKLLQQRLALCSQESQKLSEKIVTHLLAWDAFTGFQSIALYQAFRKEVDLTHLWITAHRLGKKTYFPAIHRDKSIKTMRFLEAALLDKLSPNAFYINEPFPDAPSIEPEKLDCLFIPLVGFDKEGYRLGMGHGYYDRALHTITKKNRCIGVAYSFQELDTLPHDPWDVRLDGVVTEKGLQFFYDY